MALARARAVAAVKQAQYLGSDRARLAAADAARRALAAGYRDVWVLEPGITGWADAGQPVAAIEPQERAS